MLYFKVTVCRVWIVTFYRRIVTDRVIEYIGGLIMKSVWGHEMNKLKYTYEKEYEEKPVEKIQMTKEEFNKYIKELEIKNAWKSRGIR